MNDRNEDATFNGQPEHRELREEARQERSQHPEDFSQTENDLSTGNSIRNFGEVSGTTFGSESNPAKFGNMGQSNQQGSGTADRNSAGGRND